MAEDKGADQAREAVAAASKGQLATTGQKGLREIVAVNEAEIAAALPMEMSPSRYVRIVQTELTKNPRLQECTPRSFMGAVLTAAQYGLEFGPMQQAYLIPYSNHGTLEAQLIIGYKGWLTLMNRSGEIQSVSARTVFAKDYFVYEYGLDETMTHRPAAGDRGEPIGYYCVIRKTNGGKTFVVMSRAEVEKHRDRYGKKNGKLVGPWADKDQFEAMAWKTCLLKLKTWIPMSVDLIEAQQTDGAVIRKMTRDEEPEVEEAEVGWDDDDVVEAEVVSATTVASDSDFDDEEWRSEARGQ